MGFADKLLLFYIYFLINLNQFVKTLFFESFNLLLCLREFYRVEGTDWNETNMSLFSLCLTYMFICQTCQTLEQSPSRPGSTWTAPYLVIQSPDADQCSLLLSSVSPPFFPPIFISALQHLLSVSVSFPTSSIHICSRSLFCKSLRSITVQTVSFPLHVSLFSPTNLFFFHLFVLFFKVS